jgi:ABC-2 type transport system ATP-binding protein
MMQRPMSLQGDAPPAVRIEALAHRFGGRQALHDLDLEVPAGEMCVLLGPNGGGKTTLFRILATLLRPTSGSARIFGRDAWREPDAVRRLIGVVFQSPAIDRQLTVRENLEVQGQLYGLKGPERRREIESLLERFRLRDRADDRAGALSGGLLRRVEIVKGLLHRPRLLLLDEPSSGLDPGARHDLREHLGRLRARDGVTVFMTSHLMEEAESADRLAILSEGRLVALGTPAGLKAEIAGDVVVITTPEPEALRDEVRRLAGAAPLVVEGTLRLETPHGHALIPRLAEAFPGRITSIAVGRPTLFDVFVRRTGHRFLADDAGGREGQAA